MGDPHAPTRVLIECYFLAGNLLGIKEESRTGVIQALWTYIKTNNLQDKVDRKRIHADSALRPVRMLPISGNPTNLRASH